MCSCFGRRKNDQLISPINKRQYTVHPPAAGAPAPDAAPRPTFSIQTLMRLGRARGPRPSVSELERGPGLDGSKNDHDRDNAAASTTGPSTEEQNSAATSVSGGNGGLGHSILPAAGIGSEDNALQDAIETKLPLSTGNERGLLAEPVVALPEAVVAGPSTAPAAQTAQQSLNANLGEQCNSEVERAFTGQSVSTVAAK